MQNKTIKVIVIRSMAYTGTTWINCVLSCHERGFYLGPPQRAWEMPEEKANETCLIHHQDCWLWGPFIKNWDRTKNFISQLSEFSGKNLIILNNPSNSFLKEVLNYELFDIRFIRLVRDGRANATSAARHLPPGRYSNWYDLVKNWYAKSILKHEDWLIKYACSGYFLLRYEDFVNRPLEMISKIEDFIGEKYPKNFLRFWEFEHHFTAANTGMVDMLLKLQGKPGFCHKRKPFYDKAIKSLKKRPEQPVIDMSWEKILTRADRFIYDYLCGEYHSKLGYERDIFSGKEKMQYLNYFKLPETPENAPEKLDISVKTHSLREQFRVDIIDPALLSPITKVMYQIKKLAFLMK